MKLTGLVTGFIAAASLLVPKVLGDVDVDSEQTSTLNLDVDYSIEEYVDAAATDVLELYNGEKITLSYTISNNEEYPVGVVGVGGSFRDPRTNEIVTNLTSSSVGPIVLEAGQSQRFKQAIELNLYPENYILAPQLYLSISQQFLSIQARMQLANVSDKPISLFNPQLLFLEVVLLGTFAIIGFVVYELFGKNYFKSTSTAPTKKASTGTKASSPGPAASGKSYDSSWIPEGHLKNKKKAN